MSSVCIGWRHGLCPACMDIHNIANGNRLLLFFSNVLVRIATAGMRVLLAFGSLFGRR